MLDELVAVPGWSRDNARWQVSRAGQRRTCPALAKVRKPRAEHKTRQWTGRTDQS